ncbi:ribosomal protein S18-alanine N-acetyltransferase [Hyphobacterium sp. CCMP332]|uniref:ribosomal protein S18-alanine N-acetyltransferase n=1 Tax=Hyphobacterium sp. CCMP332 TaxID=2749086 RepID=UPI00164EE719|nr:ribosomal protein S18-alanine N-acetyltransferase [Hyphobacterium sp. CCMP332]QNL19852.1 ribosomal protein S18-alanine N-acetyltransferase [Hyphobacterium sp. CCMP332]
MISVIKKDAFGGLADLHARCFPRGWSSTELAQLAAEPGVIALSAGTPRAAGFILVRVALDEAEVLTLATDPDRRRAGIGRSLLAEALTEARHAGAKTAFLEVSDQNAAAISLYQSAGFVQGGRRRAYYPDGSDALVMEKTLGE